MSNDDMPYYKERKKTINYDEPYYCVCNFYFSRYHKTYYFYDLEEAKRFAEKKCKRDKKAVGVYHYKDFDGVFCADRKNPIEVYFYQNIKL